MSSRPPSDASRFTQTTPNARQPPNSRKPPAGPSTLSNKQPVVPGTPAETPAQKVARLRANHIAKRQAQISTWDIVVVRGRRIADIMHRWTVMGIVGASFILVGVTGYTIVDMVRYNRAKKAEFYAEQSNLLKQRFLEALEAEGTGSATADQLELLKEERAVAAAVEAKKQAPGVWKGVKDRVKYALDLNLSKEDRKYGERRADILERIEAHEREVAEGGNAVETISPTLQAIEEKRRNVEKELVAKGEAGPLDQLAEEATTKTKSSWWSWW